MADDMWIGASKGSRPSEWSEGGSLKSVMPAPILLDVRRPRGATRSCSTVRCDIPDVIERVRAPRTELVLRNPAGKHATTQRRRDPKRPPGVSYGSLDPPEEGSHVDASSRLPVNERKSFPMRTGKARSVRGERQTVSACVQ